MEKHQKVILNKPKRNKDDLRLGKIDEELRIANFGGQLQAAVSGVKLIRLHFLPRLLSVLPQPVLCSKPR